MKVKDIQLKIVRAKAADLKVDAIAVSSVGKLPRRPIVIQAQAPKQLDENSVRQAIRDVIDAIADIEIKSLAVPAIGTKGKFPVIWAAKIMAQEILKFGWLSRTKVKELTIYVENAKTLEIYEQQVFGYLEHFQNKLGPFITVDIIIEMSQGIILIERSNPPYGWALPGGFLDYGESLESCAAREAKEETNMDLEHLRQFHTYSDPLRDARFHTVSAVFIAKGLGRPQFGDDAKGLKIVPYEKLLDLEYAFDHKKVIYDYLTMNRKLNY